MTSRPPYDFSQERVLITGGASILGPVFARAFLAHGASVLLTDVAGDRLDRETGAFAETYGERIAGRVCDVTDEDHVEAAAAEIVERFGGLTVLMNNAAYLPQDFAPYFAAFEDYSLAEWRRVMAVNVDGMFLMARAAARRMRESGRGGSIIQTSSIYGLVAADDRIYEGSEYLGSPINNPAPYATSKAAVIGLSRWLSVSLARHGIRVNTIAPGGVESGQNESFQRKYGERVPLGRMAHAEEMASTALYLASPASSYVTGQCIAVDGGLTAW